MRRSLGIFALCSLYIVAAPAAPVQAATLTIHATELAFLAAAGGPVASQDFEGYAIGTDLSGVAFLTGVSATTNMDDLQVFGAADHRLFGTGGRSSGDARYDIALSLPTRALAFDIDAFESVPGESSTAASPGIVTVWFADLTSRSFNVSGNLTGAAIFIGLTSDTDITSVRWAEALEGNQAGNEETALDNFRVVQRVAEPTTLLLLGSGLVGLLARRRR